MPALPSRMPFRPILPTPFLTWVALLGAMSVLLALAEWLVRTNRLHPEVSRQLVHAAVGVAMLLTPFLFQEATFPLVTGLAFAAVNLAARRRGALQAIHGVERASYGTVIFPLAYVMLVALFWQRDPAALMVGLLLLSFADPLAARVGRRYGRSSFTLWQDPKTVAGSAAMFLASVTLALACLYFLVPMSGGGSLIGFPLLVATLLTAVMATIAEAQSRQGSDNFSVPLVAALTVSLFRSFPAGELFPLVAWAGGSAVVLAWAARLGALAVSGALTAWGLGLLIFLAGGWTWVLPLVAFLTLSSALTFLGPVAGSGRDAGRRNLVQVLANGGIPLIVALANGLWQLEGLYLVLLAALAGVSADTWGTEIGGWRGGQTRDIVSWRSVPSGTSGGVSLAGTVGSLAGAGTLAAVGLALRPGSVDTGDFVAITAIGFGAALVDSLLGSTAQVRYLVPATGQVVEERPPAEPGLPAHSGWPWLDNNMVNLACSLSGAAMGLIWVTL